MLNVMPMLFLVISILDKLDDLLFECLVPYSVELNLSISSMAQGISTRVLEAWESRTPLHQIISSDDYNAQQEE